MSSQFFLELLRAITLAAGPRFCSIFVTAIAARVRILHAEQVEIFFPIRPLFRERRITKTGLDPSRHALFVYARLLHVIEVFVAGDRALPERFIFDRTDKCAFLSRFYLGFYEIAHERNIARPIFPGNTLPVPSAVEWAPPGVGFGVSPKPAPGTRALPRQDNRNAAEKSHFFSLQLICDEQKKWRGIEP